MNRDFKGVWVPRDIWLSKELSAIEKVILVEIDSLDNDEHCFASNEYFAEFCNCSVPTVTRAIKHLKELNYIEVSSFDGRHRLIKMIKQTNQNDEADSSKRLTSNLVSKTNSKKEKSSTKVLLQNSETETSFLGSVSKKTEEKPKKKNLYEKCMDLVVNFTSDLELQNALKTFLDLRLEMARSEDKQFYYGMWAHLISELKQLAYDDSGTLDVKLAREIVNKSTSRGWKHFYELTSNDYVRNHNLRTIHDKVNESGAVNVPHITEEDKAEIERMIALGEIHEY